MTSGRHVFTAIIDTRGDVEPGDMRDRLDECRKAVEGFIREKFPDVEVFADTNPMYMDVWEEAEDAD